MTKSSGGFFITTISVCGAPAPSAASLGLGPADTLVSQLTAPHATRRAPAGAKSGTLTTLAPPLLEPEKQDESEGRVGANVGEGPYEGPGA